MQTNEPWVVLKYYLQTICLQILYLICMYKKGFGI